MFRKILAATAALTLGLGGVFALAVPASATGNGGGQTEHVPVNVCHATSSDSNPYVFLTVDDDSTKFKGHLMHRNDPNKTWKSDGVWNGVFHSAGDSKADLIGSYTDTAGTYFEYDGEINDLSDCGSETPKPDDEVDVKTIDRMSCEAGVEEQTTTTTTPYVWDGEEWVLDEKNAVVEVSNWVFVRDLTDEERNRLECDPVEPVEVRPIVEFHDPTCDEPVADIYVRDEEGVTIEVTGKIEPGSTVVVTATAMEGFEIVGKSVWEHTFGDVPTKASCNPDEPKDPQDEPKKDEPKEPELAATGAGELLATAGLGLALILSGGLAYMVSRRRGMIV